MLDYPELKETLDCLLNSYSYRQILRQLAFSMNEDIGNFVDMSPEFYSKIENIIEKLQVLSVQCFADGQPF